MVYVDPAAWVWRGKRWCHLTADSMDELHAFAEQIGLKRQWFQAPPKTKYPHYDMIEWRRTVAIRQGAQQISSRELLTKAKELLNVAADNDDANR